MPALSIAAAARFAANDIEDAVTAAELDWLAHYLIEVRSFTNLSDPKAGRNFDDAWLRLERLAVALGMPEYQSDGVVAWVEDLLRQYGRHVPQPAALTVGTPEYRQRHIAMIWQANLWHEAVMILSGAGAIGLLFYAIAKGMRSWF
jgi:hypothetical protein